MEHLLAMKRTALVRCAYALILGTCLHAIIDCISVVLSGQAQGDLPEVILLFAGVLQQSSLLLPAIVGLILLVALQYTCTTHQTQAELTAIGAAFVVCTVVGLGAIYTIIYYSFNIERVTDEVVVSYMAWLSWLIIPTAGGLLAWAGWQPQDGPDAPEGEDEERQVLESSQPGASDQ